MAFCHANAVAHGSLGSGSLLLSHFDDRRPEQLLVKLDNFGYARRIDAPDGEVEPSSQQPLVSGVFVCLPPGRAAGLPPGRVAGLRPALLCRA